MIDERLILSLPLLTAPDPPLSRLEQEQAIHAAGIGMGQELLSLYSVCNGFQAVDKNGCEVQLLPIGELSPARVCIYGTDSAAYGPRWPTALFHYGDGAFLAFNSETFPGNATPLYDCWPGEFAEEEGPEQVAESVVELLQQWRSEGVFAYWLA